MEKTRQQHKMNKNTKKALVLTSMALPGALWFFLLRYVPMAGIILAFKDYKVWVQKPSFWNNLIHSEWVGIDNFKFLINKEAPLYIRNTIGYNILWIALGLILSVGFALILNEISRKFVAKTYQTLMFFPFFLSWVVVSYFVLAFLDPTRGLLVHLAEKNGQTPLNWYHDTTWWPLILTICNVWKNTGYSCILYLAAITGIDQSQYEAAAIDGASKWQQMKNITLPNLRPMISILLIMNVGKIFNSDFGLFYSVPMNSGTLIPVTQTIDTYVYRVFSASNDLGMSTAAGVAQNVVGFIFLMLANSIVKKIDEESSLF